MPHAVFPVMAVAVECNATPACNHPPGSHSLIPVCSEPPDQEEASEREEDSFRKVFFMSVWRCWLSPAPEVAPEQNLRLLLCCSAGSTSPSSVVMRWLPFWSAHPCQTGVLSSGRHLLAVFIGLCSSFSSLTFVACSSKWHTFQFTVCWFLGGCLLSNKSGKLTDELYS